MNIDIVKMDMHHLDELCVLEQECFTIPWSRESFRQEIADTAMKLYFVAEEAGKVVGYAGMWHVVNEGHITNVAVAESHRGQGIGDILVQRLIAEAHAREMIGLTLEVRMSNYAAQKLYTKNGFKPEGIRKNYYSETKEDAIVMWLNFDAEAGD